MIIDIKRLSVEGDTFRGDEPSAFWELPPDQNLRADRPVHYELKAYVVSDELVVRGRLETQVDFRCSRCGEFFTMTVSDPAFACVREILPGMESADLTAEIRETIILCFPAYPVCRTDCRGLCAQCGASLSEGECHCRPPADGRWGMLSHLNVKQS